MGGAGFRGGWRRRVRLWGATAAVVVQNHVAPPAARRTRPSASVIGRNLHEVGSTCAKSGGHKERPQLSPKSFCQQAVGGGGSWQTGAAAAAAAAAQAAAASAASAAAPWVTPRLAPRYSLAANSDDAEFKVDNYEQLCTTLKNSRRYHSHRWKTFLASTTTDIQRAPRRGGSGPAVAVAASRGSERESCGAASGLPSHSLDAGPLLRPANLRGRHPRCHWQQVNCRFCVPTAVAQGPTFTVSPEVTLNTFVIARASAAVGSGRSIFRLNTQLQRGPREVARHPGGCAEQGHHAHDPPRAPASGTA